jgi:hypothetical protein
LTTSISWRVRMLALFVLAAAAFATLSVTARPANAALGVACPDPASQVFRPWGDWASYALVPNGGFENGASGWAVSGGARVVDGNESFYARNSGDDSSLSLPAGGSVISPPMCISLLNSKMRFFVANAGNPGARLKVQVLYNGGVGALLSIVTKLLGLSDVGYVTAGAAWQPSEQVGMLSGALPLLTSSVQFRFTAVDAGGSWQIDDVYLDPVLNR